MKHAALTARYRPQTFAAVAGQDTVKAILSRASLEDRVAPAYLFSGTRGVGKTTLARIFAKALNCREAPTAEPCNRCDQCRAVTLGNAVDVVEIDGASNRGIDDVRRLREVVGYAPMEGRYKIFIIDEAHMLSREAFNALLKTLEEPPARVTFILATTEPHKFPATIVSRCQHYVFRSLSEKALAAHLAEVLGKEGVPFEDSALGLIARRGAGSVRDSMSLLGQVLALGENTLSEASARSVLGLAGQEAFSRLLVFVREGDGPGASLLLGELLDQGLDMGFFLRELASLWRNLFMLRQSGASGAALTGLPEDEAKALLSAGEGLSLQHIHACWQMTLEGQRRVLTSLEPALALELLLLNLAMLPRLLSLETLSSLGRKPGGGRGGPEGGSGPQGKKEQAGKAGGQLDAAPRGENDGFRMSAPEEGPGFASGPESGAPALSPAEAEQPPFPGAEEAASGGGGAQPRRDAASHEALGYEISGFEAPDFETSGIEASGGNWADPFGAPPHPEADDPPHPEAAETRAAGFQDEFRDEPGDEGDDEDDEGANHTGGRPGSGRPAVFPGWGAFLALCEDKELPAGLLPLLRVVSVRNAGERLLIVPPDRFAMDRLRAKKTRALLASLLAECCAQPPQIRIGDPEHERIDPARLKDDIMDHPLVRQLKKEFNARFVDCGPWN